MAKWIGAKQGTELEALSKEELEQEVERCRSWISQIERLGTNAHNRKYYQSRIHTIEKLIARRRQELD